eukprot:Gb_32054 [translate_table: standard]
MTGNGSFMSKKQLEQLKSEEVNWDEDKWRECCMLRGENNKFEVSKLTDQLNQKRADWRDLQNLDDMFKSLVSFGFDFSMEVLKIANAASNYEPMIDNLILWEGCKLMSQGLLSSTLNY